MLYPFWFFFVEFNLYWLCPFLIPVLIFIILTLFATLFSTSLASSSVYKFYHFICRSLNICVFVRVCSDRNIMRVGSSDYRPACQTGNVRELLMFSAPPSWFWDHSLQAPLPIMMHKKIVLQGLSIQMSWSVGQVTTVCCSQVIFRWDEGKHSYIH